jgi:hypothetical protein
VQASRWASLPCCASAVLQLAISAAAVSQPKVDGVAMKISSLASEGNSAAAKGFHAPHPQAAESARGGAHV